MSRRILIGMAVFTAFLSLSSCEEEKDFFINYNVLDVKFSLRNKAFSDSLVDSIKLGFTENCKLKMSRNFSTIEVRSLFDYAPSAFIALKSDDVDGGFGIEKGVVTETGEKEIFIKGGKIGNTLGLLIFKDGYGKEVKKKVKLTVFDNLEPVTNMQVDAIKNISPYEIEINLSNSYDRDAVYGGKIIEYEYRVGDFYILRTSKFASIKFVLPQKGSYLIKCRVKDNNNVYSTEKTKEITV
jgi:hypothetical protein